MKTALIFGVSGQDGAYLCRLLLDRGYAVVGTSRDAELQSFGNLTTLGVKDKVRLKSLAPAEFQSVLEVLKSVKPSEVYNLSGQSSVGLSFEQPIETFESITNATVNILEAIRFLGLDTRFYSAASSECFGNCGVAADEETPLRPLSPYATAKTASHFLVKTYREAYGLYACSGFLFNHESPLRPERFVTQKIVSGACRIASGATQEKLRLGRLDIVRDWGWAPEFVDGIHRILQQPKPDDFVLATGRSHSLEEFVDMAFTQVGLRWQDHVVTDPSNHRPLDILKNQGNPAKAKRVLGWTAEVPLQETVKRMIEAHRA